MGLIACLNALYMRKIILESCNVFHIFRKIYCCKKSNYMLLCFLKKNEVIIN